MPSFILFFYNLIRPVAGIAFVVPTIGGMIDAGFSNAHKALFLLLPFHFLLFGGIYGINHYSDRFLDRESLRVKDIKVANQPFVAKKVAPMFGLKLSAYLLLSSLLFAWKIGMVIGFLETLVAIDGFFYSLGLRFKARPLLDVGSTAIAVALSYLIGWLTFAPIEPKVLIGLFWWVPTISSLYLVTVINDMEYDKIQGLKTTAIWLGKKKTYWLAFFLYLFGMTGLLGEMIFQANLFSLILGSCFLYQTKFFWKFAKEPETENLEKSFWGLTIVGAILLAVSYFIMALAPKWTLFVLDIFHPLAH